MARGLAGAGAGAVAAPSSTKEPLAAHNASPPTAEIAANAVGGALSAGRPRVPANADDLETLRPPPPLFTIGLPRAVVNLPFFCPLGWSRTAIRGCMNANSRLLDSSGTCLSLLVTLCEHMPTARPPKTVPQHAHGSILRRDEKPGKLPSQSRFTRCVPPLSTPGGPTSQPPAKAFANPVPGVHSGGATD
jgi:hypothetical protein